MNRTLSPLLALAAFRASEFRDARGPGRTT